MNLKTYFPLFVAKKYFFSKKLDKSINIISLISLISITFVTASLIIVLSIFNGLEGMIKSSFNEYNPDLVIKPKLGKFISCDSVLYSAIKSIKNIKAVSKVITETAFIEYDKRAQVAELIGVDSNYYKVSNINKLIISGENKLNYIRPRAIVGGGLASILSVNIYFNTLLKVYFPNKKISTNILNADNIFKYKYIKPSGIFSIQSDESTNQLIVPIAFTQNLLDIKKNQISEIYCKLNNYKDEKETTELINEKTNNQFNILNRSQQEEDIFKLFKLEKLMIFIILCFIIVIASFSIVSSISMLIINKRKDIQVFTFIGAEKQTIKSIFFLNSLFVIIGGAFLGVLLGSLITYIQETFHVIKVNGLIIDYYPVILSYTDILNVLVSVTIIACIISILPVKLITNKIIK